MEKLSGIKISKAIRAELKEEVESLTKQNIIPCLAVILVGDDPASHVYVNSKKKACEALGIKSIERRLPDSTTQKELVSLINELNNDQEVHGILCQLPLPKHCNEDEIINLIDPTKDVDCFHPYNVGLLTTGNPRFMPCTPFSVCQILKRSNIETSGKNIAIVGRSNIVGRPLSILLSLKEWNATVTVCHSRTKNLPEVCKQADIVVAAIGKPKFITKDFIKEGAVVIDVGTNQIDDPNHAKGGYLVGDVDYEGISATASCATPVPGGVGPMTITMLMYNTINACRLQNNLSIYEL